MVEQWVLSKVAARVERMASLLAYVSVEQMASILVELWVDLMVEMVVLMVY